MYRSAYDNYRGSYRQPSFEYDVHLVNAVVRRIKSQGLYDEIRRDCVVEIEKTPAYQRLKDRVEVMVSKTLRRTKWTPQLDKIQLRQDLKTEILGSALMHHSLNELLNDVIRQKVIGEFCPNIERSVADYLGISDQAPSGGPKRTDAHVPAEPDDTWASPDGQPTGFKDDRRADANVKPMTSPRRKSPPKTPPAGDAARRTSGEGARGRAGAAERAGASRGAESGLSRGAQSGPSRGAEAAPDLDAGSTQTTLPSARKPMSFAPTAFKAKLEVMPTGPSTSVEAGEADMDIDSDKMSISGDSRGGTPALLPAANLPKPPNPTAPPEMLARFMAEHTAGGGNGGASYELSWNADLSDLSVSSVHTSDLTDFESDDNRSPRKNDSAQTGDRHGAGGHSGRRSSGADDGGWPERYGHSPAGPSPPKPPARPDPRPHPADTQRDPQRPPAHSLLNPARLLLSPTRKSRKLWRPFHHQRDNYARDSSNSTSPRKSGGSAAQRDRGYDSGDAADRGREPPPPRRPRQPDRRYAEDDLYKPRTSFGRRRDDARGSRDWRRH